MTLAQQIITVGMCVLATLLTRFLPFAVFNARKPTPQYIHYLGELLPGAIFAMLVIYCLRNVSLLSGSHGLPELIGIAVTVGLHLWKRQMPLSIAAVTVSTLPSICPAVTRSPAFRAFSGAMPQ